MIGCVAGMVSLWSLLSVVPALEASDQTGHAEQPTDPPATALREEMGRSLPATVVHGNFRSVQVNVDSLGNNIVGDAANEPSLAIDPTNPNNMVIGWRQFDTIASNFRQAGVAYSHDGGATWTFPDVLDRGQFRSDPVLAVDSEGTFFYYSLSALRRTEMFISYDKGVRWSDPIPTFGGDKTWMTADTTGSPGSDHLYTIWNSQFSCCTGRDFSRSTDGGLTYDGPFRQRFRSKWGTVDVGPEGEVYVAGTRTTPAAFPSEFLLMRSSNARLAGERPEWELTTGLELGGSTAFFSIPNPAGLAGQVWVAVDRSGGPGDGNVYVLASVDPPGFDPLDVSFVRSTDGGATFSPPLRVNRGGTGTFQWFGTMSVAPNGRIDVVWNDTHIDSSAELSEVCYTYSDDTGLSFAEAIPVTPAWNSLVGHPNQAKIGDYYHMASDTDGAHLAYAATFNEEQDVWFLRLGDCDGNGRHDADDIRAARGRDRNENGVLDICEHGGTCRTPVFVTPAGCVNCVDGGG